MSLPKNNVETSKSTYRGLDRSEMLDEIVRPPAALLDIGCGEGRFAEVVKRRYPDVKVVGIEPDGAAAKTAESRLDLVINSTLDRASEKLHELRYTFDTIVMNDVLEHIEDTAGALQIVGRLLKPDGSLILSIPNVRYYLNVRDLALRGEWEYKDFGILDRTHLRFFTRSSIKSTLEQAGFVVETLRPINRERVKLHWRALFFVLPGSFQEMLFPQFSIRCRKSI